MKCILVSALVAAGLLACSASAFAQAVTFNITGDITGGGTCQ